MKFFHVSKKYLGETVILKPRLPDTANIAKEGNIPRVCFSISLPLCLRSILGGGRSLMRQVSELIEFRSELLASYGFDPRFTTIEEYRDYEERIPFINPSVYEALRTDQLYEPPAVGDFRTHKEHWSISEIECEFIGRIDLNELVESRLVLTTEEKTLNREKYTRMKNEMIDFKRMNNKWTYLS
jgi:hypothetical protein